MREIIVQIDDGMIWIGEDNTSGSEYEGTTPEEIAYALQEYLQDNEEE